MSPLKKILISVTLISLSLVIYSAKAQAATYYWVGPLNNSGVTSLKTNWNTAAATCGTTGNAPNAPLITDTVNFGDSTNKCSSNATIDSTLSAASITVDSTYAGTITNTAGITLAGSFNIQTAVMPMAGAGVTIFTVGGVSSLSCNGNLPGVIQVVSISSSAFSIGSGCSVVGDTSISWKMPAATFTNNGTITINSGTWTINSVSATPIVNNGTITHNGSGWTLGLGVSLNNTVSGSITYAGSILTISGSLTMAGTFDLTGKTVIFNPNATNPSLTCSGNLGGQIRVSSAYSTSFTINSGCSVVVDTSTNWKLPNATFTNNGSMTINSGTWTMDSVTLTSFVNNGTITNNATSWIANNAVNITNNASGTITYSGASFSETGTFINSGTFLASSVTTMSISGSLTNAVGSSMTLGNTTLTVGGDFTQSGTLSGMTGVTVFSGSTVSSILTCTGTLPGAVQVKKSNIYQFTLVKGCTINVDTSVAWTMSSTMTNNGVMNISSGI